MDDINKRILLEPIEQTFRGPGGVERTEMITELTWTPVIGLKAKHMRATDGHQGYVAQSIALIAHFTGHPIKVIDELGAEDFEFMTDVIAGFQRGRQTGATS